MASSEISMLPRVIEANFDGLVGPTFNYSALAVGNRAAEKHEKRCSNPRKAALQGLEKMKFLLDRGLVQGVLPPHERPYIPFLRQLGFEGSDEEVLERAGRNDPSLVSTVCSSAAMWAANAATVTPSSDSNDGKVHFTPANLVANAHRSLEAPMTRRLLQRIFPEGPTFTHHPPLPALAVFGDEGAANHIRLCRSHSGPGVHLFAYGRFAFDRNKPSPRKYAARQTWEACAALMRLHRLRPETVTLAQQNPQAIDKGIFHNDVIALSNENLLVVHEQAFLDTKAVLKELRLQTNGELDVVEIGATEMTLAAAVSSYFFNSQLVSLPEGGMGLLLPRECDRVSSACRIADRLVAEGKVCWKKSFNLRESMRNGGGPACLRLRIVLTANELAQVHTGCLLSKGLYQELVAWVKRHYRDHLSPEDLTDPQLLRESREALGELSSLLGLGSVYAFQGAEG